MFGKNEIRQALDDFKKEVSSKQYDSNRAKANADVFANQASIAIAHMKQALTKFNDELDLIKRSMDSVSRPEDTKRGSMETAVATHYDNSVSELYDEMKRIRKKFL